MLLTASGLRERYEVHAADLERGLLIGRYERCAFGAEDERLSRVHLLLLRDGEQIWAIDTASSNGTTAGGAALRQLRLGPSAELDLADAVTFRWTADPLEGDGPGPSLIDAPLDDLLRALDRAPQALSAARRARARARARLVLGLVLVLVFVSCSSACSSSSSVGQSGSSACDPG